MNIIAIISSTILLLTTALPAAAFTARELFVDTGCHTARVWNIARSNDGTQIVTSSQDKTLRVWDAKTLQPVRIIRGQAGQHGWGMEYGAKLFLNDTYLVTRGLYGTPYGAGHDIRVYDFKTGRSYCSLFSDDGMDKAFAISEDGEHLIAGNTKGEIYVFGMKEILDRSQKHPVLRIDRVNGAKLKDDYITVLHKYRSDPAKIDLKPAYQPDRTSLVELSSHTKDGDVRILSISKECVSLYSLTRRTMLKSSPLKDVKKARITRHYAIASDSDGITINDAELNRKATFTMAHKVHDLRISPDERTLAIMLANRECALYDIRSGAIRKLRSDGRLDVSAMEFIDNKTLAFADENAFTLFAVDTATGKELPRSAGLEALPIWGLGARGSEIALGTEPYVAPGDQPELEIAFDLKTFTARPAAGGAPFAPLPLEQGVFRAKWKRGEKRDSIELYRGNTLVSAITPDERTHPWLWTYGITPYGFVVAGGPGGTLLQWLTVTYDDGNPVKGACTDHAAAVTSFACSDRHLFSGSIDRTIVIYDLHKMLDAFRAELVKGKTREDSTASDPKGKKEADVFTIKSTYSLRKLISPEVLARVMIGRNGEYCIWTPDGYFAASEGFRGRVGIFDFKGEGREATWRSGKEFFDDHHRPDIIRKRLEFK